MHTCTVSRHLLKTTCHDYVSVIRTRRQNLWYEIVAGWGVGERQSNQPLFAEDQPIIKDKKTYKIQGKVGNQIGAITVCPNINSSLF